MVENETVFNFGSLESKEDPVIEKQKDNEESKIHSKSEKNAVSKPKTKQSGSKNKSGKGKGEKSKTKKSEEDKIEKESKKSTKLVVPEHIKMLFDNLDKSINSAWGVQKDGKVKWDAKYNLWLVFKGYFEEFMK